MHIQYKNQYITHHQRTVKAKLIQVTFKLQNQYNADVTSLQNRCGARKMNIHTHVRSMYHQRKVCVYYGCIMLYQSHDSASAWSGIEYLHRDPNTQSASGKGETVSTARKSSPTLYGFAFAFQFFSLFQVAPPHSIRDHASWAGVVSETGIAHLNRWCAHTHNRAFRR